MTDQEARIVILENALREAQNTVEFLHCCLTNPSNGKMNGCLNHPSNGKMNGGYSYEYPGYTLTCMEYWAKIAPRVPEVCFHSMNVPDCKSCQEHHRQRLEYIDACWTVIKDDMEFLGKLAMEFRSATDKQDVARRYALVVKRLIATGLWHWNHMPPPEDQLPDEFMPKEFRVHFKV